MKRRTAMLASNIQRAVNEVLKRGTMDPRIRGMITVTGVDLTEDLKLATVKVTVFPEEHESLTMHGLKSATGRIRKETMKRVRTKEMPSMRFKLDEGLKAQNKVMELLVKAREEAAARGVDLEDQSLLDSTEPGLSKRGRADSAAASAAQSADHDEPKPNPETTAGDQA